MTKTTMRGHSWEACDFSGGQIRFKDSSSPLPNFVRNEMQCKALQLNQPPFPPPPTPQHSPVRHKE